MISKAAWAIAIGLILGSLFSAGCCSTCGTWGGAPAGAWGGYGAASGGAVSSAPPANYSQTLSADPGWRPSGSAQPASGVPATP